jgi:hypothetical protein
MFEEFVFTWHTRAGSALPVEDIALSLRARDFSLIQHQFLWL